MRVVLSASLAVAASCSAFAQSAGPAAFEVATVKPSHGERGAGVTVLPGGQTYLLANSVLRVLVSIAYDVALNRISCGPDWISSEGYDIEAKSDQGRPRFD